MKYPGHEEWSYKIGGKPLEVVLSLGFFAVFGGGTVWLYVRDSIFWDLFGVFAVAALANTLGAIYRLLFLKLYVGRSGAYCQTNPFNGKYYKYTQIVKAWTSVGRKSYIHIALPNERTVHILYQARVEAAGAECILTRVDRASRENPDREVQWDGFIDAKDSEGIMDIAMCVVMIAFCTALMVMVLLQIQPGIQTFVIVLLLAFASAYFCVICYAVHRLIRDLSLKVCIGSEGFYFRDSPTNGRFYRYGEIASYRVKKTKNVTQSRREYVHLFIFKDSAEKTRKFSFLPSVHGQQIRSLKGRIGEDKAAE